MAWCLDAVDVIAREPARPARCHGRVDGVFVRPRRRDAVDVAVRASTRAAREPRPRRDGVDARR